MPVAAVVCAAVVLFVAACPASMRAQAKPGITKPVSTEPGPGDDTRNIVVKFGDDFRLTTGERGVPTDRLGKGLRSPSASSLMQTFADAGATWTRMSGASEEETHRMAETAARNLGREIARLNNYFILTVPAGADPKDWIDRLNALDDVEIALFVPLPVPQPVPGSFQSRQGYLNAATDGINANYAWSIGDSGQNVTICDFEYWWNLSHQDLPPGITTLVPPGWTAVSLFPGDTNHGTAVLGELASLNNGWGTTGAAYGANIAVAHTYFAGYGWQIGTAMTYAMTQLNPGDVFLVEQQMGGPLHLYIPGNDTGLVPIEWWRPWYDVVVTAVGNGFHVVEAGGNGYQNLDSSVYRTGNGGHWPFLPQSNSGAIIVGAGAVPSSFYGTDTARSRLDFSNYGSRLDLQGWGEFVVTTGYGRLHNSEGTDLYYDSAFAGTSSASPIVAAAVTLVETRYETVYGGTMAPATMRSLLKSTGTAQKAGKNPVSQKIGPLPDLNSALNFGSYTLAGGTYQVGLSRTYTYLTGVAAELSQKILLGNVIFELQADYAGASGGETFPIVFYPYTAAGGNWSVTIRPAAGVASRVTSGAPPAYMPVIHLNGADRVNFDGRPGGSGSSVDWLIRNARTDSTGPAILFSNGADHNALRFLQVESQCNTAGYGTVLFGWQSDLAGNRQNSVAHNIIRDRTDLAGFPQVAVNALSITGAPNDSNGITGNEIFNWKSMGIGLSGEHWTVDSNSLYSVISQVTPLTAISVMGGNGHVIAVNDIGGSGVHSGGSPLMSGASAPFTGIALSVDTVVPTLVERNRIRNISCTSTGFANFFGIAGTSSGQLTIRRNTVGDSLPSGVITLSGTGVAAAISLMFVNGAAVEDNLVAGIRQTFATPGEMRCININSPNIFTVARNRIHSVGPSTKNVSGFVRGIYLDTFIDSVLIANNMISIGFGDTNDVRYDGMYDASMTGALRVFAGYNSVSIGGAAVFSAGSSGLNHAGMSPIRLRNNAFSNLRAGGGGFHQTLVNGTPSWFPGSSDNNVLFNLNTASLTGWLGGPMNLPGWVAASLGDVQSVNADPKFVSPATGNLHIDSTVVSPADNAGVSLLTVTDDFDGQPRAPVPDIGADEYTIQSPGSFVLLTPPDDAANQPVSGTLAWASSAAAGSYDLYLDTLSPPAAVAASGLADTSYAYSGLDTNKGYYWKVIANNSSGTIAAAGSPWKFTTGPVSGQITAYYSVEAGWNIVSVPMEVTDAHWMSLYPIAVSRAYEYAGSYQTADTLEVGNGYWVKFSDTGTVALTGEAIDRETVAVAKGWNIVGSISSEVPVSSITSDPPGLVTSQFYEYSSGYDQADTIWPGKGYWVKVSDSGKIVVAGNTVGTLTAVPSSRIRIEAIAELPPSPPDNPGDIGDPLPDRFAIDQNYPNPFNGSTVIRYALPERSTITLKIFDVLGREVVTLDDDVRDAGVRIASWEGIDAAGRPVGTGVYYARIRASADPGPGNVFHAVVKLVLVR
ncbi:MAG TPA: T9SS type A sorting domain-containing protein [Bacteroidota bacterium]|nr:T9SS type A sorting domain-containing protein [Bacteroidota bacterium]